MLDASDEIDSGLNKQKTIQLKKSNLNQVLWMLYFLDNFGDPTIPKGTIPGTRGQRTPGLDRRFCQVCAPKHLYHKTTFIDCSALTQSQSRYCITFLHLHIKRKRKEKWK